MVTLGTSASLYLGQCLPLTSSLSRNGVYCPRAPNTPLRNFFRGNGHDFSNYALVGDKRSTNKEHGKTRNPTQSLATAEGRIKPHLTPSRPKLKVTRLAFLILLPRLLTWQLPNAAGLTSEVEGPRPPAGGHGSFPGTAAPFGGSWKPPWNSGNRF